MTTMKVYPYYNSFPSKLYFNLFRKHEFKKICCEYCDDKQSMTLHDFVNNHVKSAHRLNPISTCIYCHGDYSWPKRKKHENEGVHFRHLTTCMQAYIERNQFKTPQTLFAPRRVQPDDQSASTSPQHPSATHEEITVKVENEDSVPDSCTTQHDEDEGTSGVAHLASNGRDSSEDELTSSDEEDSVIWDQIVDRESHDVQSVTSSEVNSEDDLEFGSSPNRIVAFANSLKRRLHDVSTQCTDRSKRNVRKLKRHVKQCKLRKRSRQVLLTRLEQREKDFLKSKKKNLALRQEVLHLQRELLDM